MARIWTFVSEYSLLLIGGALIALVWANLDAGSYHAITHFVISENRFIGPVGTGPLRVLTLEYLVNDVLMALFFAIAGKEVWEAIILNDGSLRGSKAATPLIATVGGMAGPVAIFLGLAALLGSATWEAVAHGWAIPTATDIAFSYLIGRIVFGAGHPAIRFLLLLAIADDAGGLIILALFYPTAPLAPQWLLLSAGAAFVTYLLFNWLPMKLDGAHAERPWSTSFRQRFSFWPYAMAGALSWYGFQQAGIHPALGLLPVIPAIPHADRGFGLFAEAERGLKDLLNTIEHALQTPVEVILFLFGFVNAGVVFSSIGTVTWLVLLGLVIGKPAGIFLFGWIAARPMQLGLPQGMSLADLFVLGCVAAIGFTVALFVCTVAFAPGDIQDGAKMGALFSFGASVLAIIAGRILRVQRVDN